MGLIVKTKAEFQLMKDDILDKLDKFIDDYDKFTRKVGSKYWRVSGAFAGELQNIKKEIPRFEPLTFKELQHDWIRDDILTDEEKEIYNNTKKYNI